MSTFIFKKPTLLTITILFLSIFGNLGYNHIVLADAVHDSTIFKACEQNPSSNVCKNHEANKSFELIGPNGLITKIAQIVVWLVGIVSVVMIAIGGFKYTTSAGDSNGVQSAKNTILYAIVGLGVAIFAQLIVSFILTRFS